MNKIELIKTAIRKKLYISFSINNIKYNNVSPAALGLSVSGRLMLYGYGKRGISFSVNDIIGWKYYNVLYIQDVELKNSFGYLDYNRDSGLINKIEII